MENKTSTEITETPTVGTGDVEEGKPLEDHENSPESTKGGETGEEGQKSEGGEASEVGEGGEGVETGTTAGKEEVQGEHVEGEHVEGEHVEGEGLEGEHVEGEFVGGEHIEGEEVQGEEKAVGERDELVGEGLEGEQVQDEEVAKLAELIPDEVVEEEERYIEEPPPDPSEPYNFSDSKEALKAPFVLRPDQLAEVEQLWEIYQNHTPAYCDIDGWITEKELVYMLKCLFLMTYTMEQVQELIVFCCRPAHPKGYIYYEQFLKMVTIRQRDFPIEEELRSALQVFDPEKEGIVDREYLKEVLAKQGYKMPAKQLENLIKEVDMSNDGTIGIEDVVATMVMDLNQEDMQALRAAVYPPEQEVALEDLLE